MTKKTNYHCLFLLIISVSYIFPLFFFGSITTFYHDNLDSLVVYNHIIGKIYKEGLNFDLIKIFLSGELEFYYLRHIFKPFVILYSLFDTELAYWITDFLFKMTSYVTFFYLAKKIQKDNFIAFLGATLFACLTPFKTLGFGLAFFPYLLYLIFFKSELNMKHYFLLIFFGLNTDITTDLFLIPSIILIIFIIDRNIIFKKFKNLIKILGLFFLCSMLTSSNFIYMQFLELEMHRIEYVKYPKTFFDNLSQKIMQILYLPSSMNWSFFKILPYTFISVPIITLALFSKSDIVKKLLVLIFIIHSLLFALDTNLLVNIYNNNNIFIKLLNPFLITYYMPVVYSLLLIYLLSNSQNYKKKTLIIFSFISIFLFQLNSSIIPLQKKFIFKDESFRNFYTFKGYYLYDDYSKIKEIVKDKRTVSLNLDPMVAAMNNINIIDGYHSMYPLAYKIRFRKIIEKELNKNPNLKNYYDGWGSRVYAFMNNIDNISINFKQAKRIGADYVLSKNPIDDDNLLLVCDNCSKFFKLYKIK
tara:strand:+ start:7443 stop:9029 length:1587 start_codon:yes stop_codon:yes gene_type:complete